MANILILGGGFSGLVAAERLAESLGPPHQITLVSPNRKFTFYPALVRLAFGACKLDDITFDLAAKLGSLGVRYIQGEVTAIDPEKQTAEIASEDLTGALGYDYLLIAIGRRLATEKIDGFFESAHHLLGTNAALKFGEAVRDFREGRIIVGMCPDARLPVPACETAFALARRFETAMSEDKVRVTMVFPESLEVAFGGANPYKELETAFEKHRINVLYDIPVNEIQPTHILSAKGHRIEYDLLMLVPPFRGNSLLSGLGFTDDSDYVKVDGMMRVYGLKKTYAAGDIVAFSGPKFAHMAVRQAETAVANIHSEIRGEDPTENYYHEIATVIDAGGADSIYLHYGIWDDSMYRLKKGRFWGMAKEAHDSLWRIRHR